MFNQQYHQFSLQRGQKQTSLWIKCHVFYLTLWDVGYKCDERLQRDKLIIPKILTLLRSGLFCFLRPGGAPSESPPFPHPSSNLSWYRHSRIMSSSFPTSRQWHVWRHHEVSIVKVDCSSGFRRSYKKVGDSEQSKLLAESKIASIFSLKVNWDCVTAV